LSGPALCESAAIATTLRQPGPSLVSFVEYHLALGFSRIYLFFDDPADAYIDAARKFREVRIIKSDGRLRQRWRRTKTALNEPWFFRFVEVELKVRQTLNVEIAISLARKDQIDWLLHIDCDELFYPAQGSVPAHFAALAKRKLDNLIYANYEGVPEAIDIDDPFKKVTLFKKNYSLEPMPPLTANQRRLIRKIPQLLPDHLFLFYANGKSAARVNDALLPNGGHRFKYAHRGLGGSKQKHPRLCRDAIILHYPCCGFKNFWRKYKMLGSFPDRWFGQVEIREAIGSFHLESRDVVLQCNRRAARTFYEQRVVMKDRKLTDALIKTGILCRITEPSEFLRSRKAKHGKQW
jgi:hypothetical protein